MYIFLFQVLFYKYLKCVCTEYSATQNSWNLTTISKLETQIEVTNVSIKETTKNIERCDATIAKSGKILELARQKGNSEAERVSLERLLMQILLNKKIQII